MVDLFGTINLEVLGRYGNIGAFDAGSKHSSHLGVSFAFWRYCSHVGKSEPESPPLRHAEWLMLRLHGALLSNVSRIFQMRSKPCFRNLPCHAA